MANTKVPLLTAAETALKANAGSRVVSVVPELKNGQARAEGDLASRLFRRFLERRSGG
jgi:hypothetical protein